MTAEPALRTKAAPKQARSRARREALIEYGIELLNQYDLDEISIAEVTGKLGYATGSFYSYFADKEAFFVAVQQRVNDQLDDEFDRMFGNRRLANDPLPARLNACLTFAIGYFRRRTGVIRSALRYERRIPEGWAPNRARTQAIVQAATQNLNEADRERLETALQLAFGLLVNALLHNPGPLRLEDDDLQRKIEDAMGPFLTAQSQHQGG
ncbi:MAG: TetR/AcrR family transcriptional regulator [Paracoccaceae bacterium]